MEEQQTAELSIALAQLLTQEEFRLVWSLQFVAQVYGCYALEGASESEQREKYTTLGSAMVEGIRMAHRAGHKFSGLEVRDDDIYPYQDAEVHQGNALYIGCLAAGLWFPFKRMLQGALELVEREKLDMDTNPIKQALDDIKWSITESQKDMTPEEAREIFGNRLTRLTLGAALAQEKDKAN
jgi:hypothetical protein